MEENDLNKVNNNNEKQEEYDVGSANSDEITNLLNNFDINKFILIVNKLNKNASAETLRLKKGDTRIDILNFLKDFLPQDKKMIIDQVIEAFSDKALIKDDDLPK